MKNFKIVLFIGAIILIFSACKNNGKNFDASGSFEADEIIISSESNGVIKKFDIEEGQILTLGQLIGSIDSTQLYLKKKQLLAQVNAMLSKKPNVSVQLAALYEQLRTAEKEKSRVNNLVKADAATTKQLDDVNASIAVIQKQIEAQKSSLNISNNGIEKEASALYVQIEQLNDQLNKCQLISPMNGTVLMKYADLNEMTLAGKALYKMADLSNINLRVFISGNQLPLIKLNQMVKVNTDDGNGGFKETQGQIIWISDKAEFTPKTIQTKEERVNLVYAVKVKVKNDGTYKIGMYAEIKFQ